MSGNASVKITFIFQISLIGVAKQFNFLLHNLF